MSRKGRKDKKPRFRRTEKEIKMGLTPEKARKLRKKKSSLKRKASIEEKVGLVKVLQSGFGLDIVSPSSEPVVPEDSRSGKYADPKEVLKRIRETAAKEVARDPLLNPQKA